MYNGIHESFAVSRQVSHELQTSHASRSGVLHHARIQTNHERHAESLAYPHQAALEP